MPDTLPEKPVYRRYEGPDSRTDIDPNVAVKPTAVDYAMAEAAEDAQSGLPPRKEDESWKKRYGDLRSFAQKKEDKLKNDIKEREKYIQELQLSLEQAKKTTGGFIPTSEVELTEWSKANPEAYTIIRSIAAKEKEEEIKRLQLEITDLKGDFSEKTQEVAKAKLEAKHPDLYELAADKNFWAWIREQDDGEELENALTKTFDVAKADRILRTYKLENGLTSKDKQPKRNDKLAAAMDVSTRGSMPNIEPGRNYVFKESDISKMNDREYEANAEAIAKAQHDGKILMDITARSSIRA